MPAQLANIVESYLTPDELLLHSMSFDVTINTHHWLQQLQQECPEAYEEITQRKYALYDHAMIYLHMGETNPSTTAISILLLLGLYRAGQRCMKFLQTEIQFTFYLFRNGTADITVGSRPIPITEETLRRGFYHLTTALLKSGHAVSPGCVNGAILRRGYAGVKPIIRLLVRTNPESLNEGLTTPLLFYVALCDPVWAYKLMKLPGVKLDAISQRNPLTVYMQPTLYTNLLGTLICAGPTTIPHLNTIKRIVKYVDTNHPHLKHHPSVKLALDFDPTEYKRVIGGLLFPS